MVQIEQPLAFAANEHSRQQPMNGVLVRCQQWLSTFGEAVILRTYIWGGVGGGQ